MIRKTIVKELNLLEKYKLVLGETDCVRSFGFIESITGSAIRSSGPQAKLGEICHIYKPDSNSYIGAEVIGFEKNLVILSPLSSTKEIQIGSRVISTGRISSVYLSDQLIGRVLNSMGKPLDGYSSIISSNKRDLYADPINPLHRPMIREPLYVNIRAIDSFLTIGKGQRVGIFSGSGVGKSTLIGMIARYSKADLNVVALTGERSREVKEFIQNDLGEEGLKKSIVIVSTADESPLNKIRASLVATTIAEYFRDEGKDVLLLLDSLTRLAMAKRELGLAAGEPATTKGYPPSVFSSLPKLLERAGTSPKGSITGIYTVLVEADDMNEPVADAVRGVLDGHIILDRTLTNRGHFPSIDIPSSISRLAPQVTNKEDHGIVLQLRELISTYRENEEIINLGAYVSGANPILDKAIRIKSELDAFLRQGIDESTKPEETWNRLKKIYSSLSEKPMHRRVG